MSYLFLASMISLFQCLVVAAAVQAIIQPEQAQRTFMAAMSDSGLKPTVVYHNLNPAELYEKVQPGSVISEGAARAFIG